MSQGLGSYWTSITSDRGSYSLQTSVTICSLSLAMEGLKNTDMAKADYFSYPNVGSHPHRSSDLSTYA